jgi:hypothetical protein
MDKTSVNINHKLITTLAMASETNNPSTPLREDNLEGDLPFHDTIQRQQQQATASNSKSADNSVSSQLLPTNLVASPLLPPTNTIYSTMATKTIIIEGVTISVESSKQVYTTAGALYTKAIRETYDIMTKKEN